MGSIQILLPFAMMTVIIGLAKLYEEKLGMLLLEGLQGAVQSHTIISNLLAHPVRRSEIHRQLASAIIQDIRNHIPTRHGIHPVLVLRTSLCQFQNRPIGVILLAVIKNVLIIGHATEHLAVTGIGFPDAVGHLHLRFPVAVANHAAFLPAHLPEKRHQTVAPGTLKHLLPSQTINGNHYHSRLLLLAILAIHGEQEQQGKKQQQWNHFLLHKLGSPFYDNKYRKRFLWRQRFGIQHGSPTF